jgi:hypothetical protein
MPSFDIEKDYFLEEYHRFRKIMCAADISTEDKLEAYKGLWFVYLNLKIDMPEDDKETCKFAMDALDMELNMRIGIQVRMEIEALVRAEIEAQLEAING